MIDKEAVETFVGKSINFCWMLNGKETRSSGFLIKVTPSSIIIDFNGKTQIYSLECLLWLREYNGVGGGN